MARPFLTLRGESGMGRSSQKKDRSCIPDCPRTHSGLRCHAENLSEGEAL